MSQIVTVALVDVPERTGVRHALSWDNARKMQGADCIQTTDPNRRALIAALPLLYLPWLPGA